MSKRWHVVAPGPWDDTQFKAPLEEAGCEVVLGRSVDQFPDLAYTEDELIEMLRDADAAIVSTREQVTRRILEAAPRLRIVAKPTIGVERIDAGAATDLGILVVNSPVPENYLSVAESAIGLIIALAKRLIANQRRLREGEWKSPSSLGTLLAGKTVGIVGLGRIGANVARRLTGWDVRVLAADPFVEPALAYAVGAQLVPLDELLREADFITVHVVLIPETRHMIDEARLRTMKPTAYLVNTSRGGAIDEAALVRAIEEGWIAGAALDVFEDEPLPRSSPLRRLDPDRVILTPHVLSNTLAQRVSGNRVVAQNVLRALHGELPTFIKNPAAIERWRQRFGDKG
ncbi:MAG: phosphoglycerate dehydrogenase [Chloroflexi bacterium]|nr:phosphoglycerate dehydrogenase [Chloroflexota bacterium]